LFLEEVGLQACSVEHFVSIKQLGISWIWDIELGFNTCSPIACDSALKIFIQTLANIGMTKNGLLDIVHLNIDSVKTHLQVNQLLLLANFAIQVSVKVLEVLIPLIHEIVCELGELLFVLFLSVRILFHVSVE
jgi:hypothetical protein